MTVLSKIVPDCTTDGDPSAERIPCSSELAPGTFRETLVPAHLAAAAILWGCLWELGANRRGLAAVAAVTVALPANLAFAWLSGVSLFCF